MKTGDSAYGCGTNIIGVTIVVKDCNIQGVEYNLLYRGNFGGGTCF